MINTPTPANAVLVFSTRKKRKRKSLNLKKILDKYPDATEFHFTNLTLTGVTNKKP